MNTDIATKYPWVPFYEAVADKLLKYKSRDGRKKLLGIIQNILKDKQLFRKKNGKDEPVGKSLFYYPDNHLLPDVSPYTFIFFMACSCSTTQGKSVTPKRKRIFELIADALNIDRKIHIPRTDSDFHAIPSTEMRQPGISRFDYKNEGPGEWYQNDQKIIKSNDLIWKQFECAIKYASNPSDTNKQRLIRAYDNVVQNCSGVGYGLTRGMFQIRPSTYLTIDQNTIDYLQGFNIETPKREMTGEEYLSLLEDVRKKIIGKKPNINSFLDISYRAYSRDFSNPNVTNDNEVMSTTALSLKYIERLKHSRNLILTGAPGTGKTYLARKIAEAMNQGVELSDDDRKNTVGFVQFHPSYDYVDFVEGLRPDRSGDNVVFNRKNGIFKEFCRKAIKDRAHNYVFIIDEINRGDLSKIFGELFFAIDPGYRVKEGEDPVSKCVHTQYEGMLEDDDVFKAGFYVPDNVYIIGTMNDIDRSVESMDFALRRRFAWQKIRPEDTANDMGITGDARERMDAMNKVIKGIPELGEDYQIGGAYFLKMVKEDLSAEELWQFHLESLIDEYLRGLPNKDELYNKIKDAYDNPRKANGETKPQADSAED